MRKNMTRASVALTSTAALVASAFAGAPALAAGQADTSFVALTPTSGYSYNVLAIAGQTFSLDANQASSITATGRNVKFLVADPNSVSRPATGTTAAGSVDVDDWSAVASTNKVTVTDASHGLSVGDFVYVTGLVPQAQGGTTDEAGRAAAWGEITDADTNTFTFVDAAGVSADIDEDDADGTNSHGKDSTGTYYAVSRALDKSYVVDSAKATNTSDKVLKLENIESTATVSVDVTAWVDDNGNGVIDSTEYVSPTRTVTWVKPSTVTPSLTWSPVVIGDDKMSATVTLDPTINFDQQPQAKFEVDFQRQGSTDTEGTTDGTTGVSDTWDTEDQEWSVEAVLKQSADDTPWTGVTKQANLDEGDLAYVEKAGKVVTIYTSAAHSIKVNDRVTVTAVDDDDTSVNSYAESIFAATTATVTAVSDFSFTYSVASNTTDVAKTDEVPDGTENFHFVVASFGYATAGTYYATVKLGDTPAKIGSTFSITAGAQVAAGVTNKATVTENVSSDFKVREDHVADVLVTSTITDADGDAVGAGVPVSIAVTETSSGVVTVNGTTVTTSKTIAATTDANGQVQITVRNSSGAATETVALAVSSQGYSDTDTLTWAAASYSLTDLADNSSTLITERSIAIGGDLLFRLALQDQWGAAPAGDFRVKVTGGGTRYDFVSYAAMSNGSLNWTLTDAPVAAADMTGSVTFDVQQKDATGSWVAPTGTAPLVALASAGTEIHGDAITVNVRSAFGSSVALNGDGVSSADLSAASALTVLKAADTRTPGVAANDLSAETSDVTATITGTVKDKATGAVQDGSIVTLTGNQSILFVNGTEAAFGSITVIADGNGAFSVDAHSNAGLTDSVVTVTANGASSTVKVTFTGAAADGATTLTIDAPASAASGTTFQVTAVLEDKYGNPVEVSTSGDVKVTYTGPGLVVGTLPTTTDKDGELTFSVLLGSNDKGSAVVTVSYDQNSDDDFLDAKDLVASKTIAVGGLAASEQKVNAGSFKGYVAVYAKGYEGSRLSAKVGKDWVVVPALASNFERVVEYTGAGYTIAVRIYIDRVLVDTITVTTK